MAACYGSAPFVVQDCLEGMTAQQEMMKQLVSALGEVERGKQAGLAAFLTEYGSRIAGRPSKEDHARVKAEVRAAVHTHAGCPAAPAGPCPFRWGNGGVALAHCW
jgi:hypothetical protein